MNAGSFYMTTGALFVVFSIILALILTTAVWAGSTLDMDESGVTYEASLSIRQGEEAAREKKWNSAITAFDKAIKQNPASIIARIRKGQALADAGRMDKALAVLTVAVFLAPDSYEAFSQRGQVCIRMGHYEQALSDMNEALRLVPESAEAHYWRAWALLKLGKVHAAFNDFDVAHSINPQFPKPKLMNDRQTRIPG